MACDSPIFIKLNRPRYSGNQPIYSVNVACGKCYPCLRRRINQWAFRLIQEDKRSTSAYFITLTYDTSHVPLTDQCNLRLHKKDLQDFFKRLRYYHAKDGVYLSEIGKNERIKRKPIRYYGCGEYGGLFGRPHYHAIIFNAFPDQFEKAWRCTESRHLHKSKGKTSLINGIKKCDCGEILGNIQYREADVASFFYTLKYIEKKESKEWFYDDDVISEFSIRSKGLGDNYITEESKRHHSGHLDNNYVLSEKFKVALPRFYAKKFWPDSLDTYDGQVYFTVPHPYKNALLGHIKKVVQDETDKQFHKDLNLGLNPYDADMRRKKARNSKIRGPISRGF